MVKGGSRATEIATPGIASITPGQRKENIAAAPENKATRKYTKGSALKRSTISEPKGSIEKK
jgi:hypothetical protein